MTDTANLATEGINVDDLCSYAVDVWVSDHSILTDEQRLLKVLRTAAEKGNAQVLGEASHVFPNGLLDPEAGRPPVAPLAGDDQPVGRRPA
ncbi:hypothetical protein ABZ035_30825, partial [Streptomyces sp. NPDC006334]